MLEVALGLAGTALIGIAAWAVKLNTRTSDNESNIANLSESVTKELGHFRELIILHKEDTDRRLERIEYKIDNGRK